MGRRIVWVFLLVNAACAARHEQTRADQELASAGTTASPGEGAPTGTTGTPSSGSTAGSPSAGPGTTTGTGSTASAAGAGPATFDLSAALARELPELPRHAIRVPDNWFDAELESTGAPSIDASVEPLMIEAPLGTSAPMRCYAYRHRLDAAASVVQIVNAIRQDLEVLAVRPVDVVAVGGAPVLFAEIDYASKLPTGGRAMGQVKVAVRPGMDLSLLCTHDEPGYRESFRRITRALFASVKQLSPAAEPATAFDEIQVVRVNDLPVGFAERHFTRETSGRQIEDAYNSMLLLRSASDVLSSDSATREIADGGGRIVQVVYVKAINGADDSNLTLTAGKDGYGYDGTWEGKPLSGKIATKVLEGDVIHWKRVRALFDGKKPETTVTGYSPSTDPSAAVEVHYRKTGEAPRAVEMQLGPLKFGGRADDHGVLERSELAMGRIHVVAERIYVKGAP